MSSFYPRRQTLISVLVWWSQSVFDRLIMINGFKRAKNYYLVVAPSCSNHWQIWQLAKYPTCGLCHRVFDGYYPCRQTAPLCLSRQRHAVPARAATASHCMLATFVQTIFLIPGVGSRFLHVHQVCPRESANTSFHFR